MLIEKDNNIKKRKNKEKKDNMKKITYTYALVSVLVLISVLSLWSIWASYTGGSNDKNQSKEAEIPSISIGCDRVLWDGMQLDIKPSILNIDNPEFKWFLDDKFIGDNRSLKKKLDIGKYKISLDTYFYNKTNDYNKTNNKDKITKNISIIVTNSAKEIGINNAKESKNEWGFQTLYNKKEMGIKDVEIYIDSMAKKEVNTCGHVAIPLLAGDHSYIAKYRGEKIASGNFNLKEITDMKIEKIDIKSSYKVGETVQGKIILRNTGTTVVKGFDIKTLAINQNYKWMGDVAKKEYYDKYNAVLNPGDKYEIIVEVKIPEKVSGVAPTGKYSLTISLIMNDKTVDSKTISTNVRS